MAEFYASDADLAKRFGVTRQTVWRWHREDPNFPRAIQLSKGCTRWKLSEIAEWEAEKAAA